MSGHTKELDFRVEVRVIDQSIGTIDREGGEIFFAQVALGDPRLFPIPRDANKHRVRVTERLVACWNALEGLDPAAVADVVAALEAVRKTMDGYRSQMKLCDVEALGYFREFDRRIEASGFRTALARIRGEG